MLKELFKIFIALMTAMYLIRKLLEWINGIYKGILNWFEMNFGLFFDQSYFHVLLVLFFSFIIYRKVSRSVVLHKVINYFRKIGIKSHYDL